MSTAKFPDAGSHFAERRTVPRFAFDAHAEMSDPLVKLRALGRVTEISRGGCFVVAPDRPTVSSVIQLRIEKDSELLSTWARVIYDRPGSGAGFRFIATSPDQLKVLGAWLQRLDNS